MEISRLWFKHDTEILRYFLHVLKPYESNYLTAFISSGMKYILLKKKKNLGSDCSANLQAL